MSRIHLYAELLTNIRTVTLVASLHSESNKETRIELEGDGEVIKITHEGITASLRLPTRMTGGGTAALTLPPRPTKDLSLRLRVEETEPGLLVLAHNDENLVPWNAGALDDASSLDCVRCGAHFLTLDGEKKKVKEWRDLPAEGWAEMMDFWHCHKPREHDDAGKHDSAIANKGYSAANSKLEVNEDLGFVGLTYFVVAPESCEGLETLEHDDGNAEIRCKTCKHSIGTGGPTNEGWKLFKWSLGVSTATEPSSKSFPIAKWITTQLLAVAEASGVRRFVVQSSKDASSGLLLWMFADSVSFSSSHNFFIRKDPTRAMKLMWKKIDEPQKMIDTHQFSHEDLALPEHVYQTLSRTLEQSANILPENARKFQDWNVGLLERFDWEDIRGTDATVLPAMRPEARQGENDTKKIDEREALRHIEGSESLFE